jgi:hypothetical protein
LGKDADGAVTFAPTLDQPEQAATHDAPRRELPPTDYRPIIAVIAIVIFSLALIAFIFAMRAAK